MNLRASTPEPYIIVFHASFLPHSLFEQRRTAQLGSPDGLYRHNVWTWRHNLLSRSMISRSWVGIFCSIWIGGQLTTLLALCFPFSVNILHDIIAFFSDICSWAASADAFVVGAIQRLLAEILVLQLYLRIRTYITS